MQIPAAIFGRLFCISHEMALEKAKTEYDIYRKKTADELSQVEKDFLDSVKKTQKMLESKKQ